jgi:hypothetical protein
MKFVLGTMIFFGSVIFLKEIYVFHSESFPNFPPFVAFGSLPSFRIVVFLTAAFLSDTFANALKSNSFFFSVGDSGTAISISGGDFGEKSPFL